MHRQHGSLRFAAPERRSWIWGALRLFVTLSIVVGLGVPPVPKAYAKNQNTAPAEIAAETAYAVYLPIVLYDSTDSIPPKITSAPVTEVTAGQLYSYAVHATGNPAPAYSLTAGPVGMAIDSMTGLIEWTPTAAGSAAVTVQASNAEGTDSQSFTVHVSPQSIAPQSIAPTIISEPVTVAIAGQPYRYTVEAAGSPAPAFHLISMPAGMAIDAATGLIGWTPTAVGEYLVTVEAANEAGTDSQSFAILVSNPPAPAHITSTAGLTAIVSQTYSYDVDATGSPPPTYVLTTSPAGMTIDAATGIIGWTPTASGTAPVTVEASNPAGTDSQSFTILIYLAPAITSSPVTAAFAGQAYSYQVNAGGDPAPSFSLAAAPAGMSIDATGLIQWTPLSPGTANVTVQATNAGGSASQTFSITVSPPPPSLSFSEIWGSLTRVTGGHGAMWADVDGNNRPDLYLTLNLTEVGDKPDLFLSNKGSNSFVEEGALRGVNDADDGGSHGAAWADFDNDGDYDLVNGSTYARGGADGAPNNLYRNNGSGTFVDVTPISMAGVALPTRGVNTFDMDRDGDLDIFSVSNSGGSTDPAGELNEVYRNNGSFSFTSLTSGALVTAPAGQGATDTDFDGDGDIDVFAANRNGPVNILVNNGSGSFSLVSPGALGITHTAGDGITTADVDNDGDLDLLLTSDNQGYLYTNTGSGSFQFKRSFSGTSGYMGGFADLDNDRDLDLVFSGAGNVYLNNGSGSFTTGPSVPVTGINDPRSLAFADMDNDGDLDFAFGVKGTRNYLVRNNFNGGEWLKVKLISPNGQAGAFGAKVYLYETQAAGGALLGMREARSNYGYLGQDDPLLHFGLGGHTTVDVKVVFLNGDVVWMRDVAGNTTVTIDGR